MSILDGELAETIADALVGAGIPQAAILTTQETTGPVYAPVITNVPHDCSGWVDTYTTAERANGDVLVTDRKVFIVVNTLAATPVPGNTVTMGGATFSIITVTRDPAGACWVLQARV